MPPQLPTPASRRLEIRRGVTTMKSGNASRVHSPTSFDLRRTFNMAARFLQRRVGPGAAVGGGGGLAIVDASKQDSLRAIASFNLLFLQINEDPSAVLFFQSSQSSVSWSRSVKVLSKVLISSLFAVFNRSKSVKNSSKVLVNLLFLAFNCSSLSRSVESTSTALVNHPSVDDSLRFFLLLCNGESLRRREQPVLDLDFAYVDCNRVLWEQHFEPEPVKEEPENPSAKSAESKKGKKPKAKKPPAPRKRNPPAHPPYFEMVQEAIVTLKERTRSSQYAIQKFIAKKQKTLPLNFKKLLLFHLKKFVAADKLVKTGGSESLCSGLEVDHTDIHILMLVWKMQAEKQEVKRPSNFEDFYAYLFRYYLNEEKQKSIDIESIWVLLDLILEFSLPAKLKVVGLVAVVVKSLINDLFGIGTDLNTGEQKNDDLFADVSFRSSNGIFGSSSNITKEKSVPQKDVYHVESKFDEHDIPYVVLWLDIEQTDGKCYFTWDRMLFPNLEEMQEKLTAKGRHMVSLGGFMSMEKHLQLRLIS